MLANRMKRTNANRIETIPHSIIILCSAMIGLALSLPTRADEFEIVGSDREIFAEGTSFCPGCGPNGEDDIFSNDQGFSTANFGLFDEDAFSVGSDAMQTSLVAAGIIAGSGGIDLGFTGDNSARSVLYVEFRVPESRTYSVFGNLSIAPSSFIDELFLSVRSPDNELFRVADPTDDIFFGEHLSLTAGTLYTIEAVANGSDFSGFTSSGDWNFSITANRADFDRDGDVDGDDFLVWQQAFERSDAGDTDVDGDTDGDDFLTWQSEFGEAGTASSAAVPEPSTNMLFGLATLVFGLITRSGCAWNLAPN